MMVGVVQRQQDIWHAKALLPALTNPEFQRLECIPGKRTRYILNGERLLIIKQGKTRKRKAHLIWQFNFSAQEAKSLSVAVNSNQKVFLCLVCDNVAVCILKGEQGMSYLGNGAGDRQLSLWAEKKNNSEWYDLIDCKNKSTFKARPSSRTRFSNYFYS
jgi:hypothetical protein